MLCKACIYRFFRIAEIKKLQGIIFRLKIPNLKNQLRLTQKKLISYKNKPNSVEPYMTAPCAVKLAILSKQLGEMQQTIIIHALLAKIINLIQW